MIYDFGDEVLALINLSHVGASSMVRWSKTDQGSASQIRLAGDHTVAPVTPLSVRLRDHIFSQRGTSSLHDALCGFVL
jgi:hypothetical protein